MNFFAPYVSGDAYVGGLTQPGSEVRLPVTKADQPGAVDLDYVDVSLTAG